MDLCGGRSLCDTARLIHPHFAGVSASILCNCHDFGVGMSNRILKLWGKTECSAIALVMIFALLIGSTEGASAQSQVPSWVLGQGSSYGGQPGFAAPAIIAPLPPPRGQLNSAGWNTGYSAVTSTSERANPLGYALGGSRTLTETVTRVVPNDPLGQPIRGPVYGSGERNSAGWSTGYSVVTRSYERADPFGRALGGSATVKETTTSIVPNNALGDPIEPILPLWP